MKIKFLDNWDNRKLAEELIEAKPRTFMASYIKNNIVYVVSNVESRTQAMGLLMQIIISMGEER